MFDWVKHSVGISEPVYGPSAIQSVAQQAKETPYTNLTPEDLKWELMDSTNVETKSFYMTSDDGHIGLCQVIYSNVLGVRTTAQFSAKVFNKDPTKPHAWSSHNIPHFSFSPDRQNFYGNDCSMELVDNGTAYHIKSTVDKKSIVDIKFTRSTPGFAVGKNGTSYYGTDPKKPWGRMKHAFWPRNAVEGTIKTPEGTVDFKGKGMFVHALQGMKPHFAAAKWNFVNFQSPSYSAILMDYTTPPSYGSTGVTVGGLTTKDSILIAGSNPDFAVTHTEVKGDKDNNWPEPGAAKFSWKGKNANGQEVSAVLEGSLETRTDRVDVMGELPKFVKQIVAGASGTKPYIYQFVPKMKIKVNVGGQEIEEEGQLFMEATFIS